MTELTEDFTTHIIDLHGEDGREWLDTLPTLISSIEEQWCIRVDEPFRALTYNYVAPATREDGAEAILKLGVPGDHVDREAECLRQYDGQGAAYILGYDLVLGAMLLERVRPGTDLKQLTESEAIEATVTVMRQLHRVPAPDTRMPTVTDWWNGFQRLRNQFSGTSGPIPGRLVDEAESLYADLVGSMDQSVLLHGDLHHENILAGDRLPWIAIDPQGVIGEPAYEVGAFLRNPMPDLLKWSELDKILERRVAALSELLGIDRQRIAGWGYSQAVLSGIWSLEDEGSGWEGPLEVAYALRKSASV
jgi:streptomycin 6-kinase